jgi:hypothetical protein
MTIISSEEDRSQPHIHCPPPKTPGEKIRPATKSLELPLIVALGISPICLLLPVAISERSVAKEAIYNVSSVRFPLLSCVGLSGFCRFGRV